MKKFLTTLTLGLAIAAGVQAQTWPDKPVTLLVPFPPGGSTDLIARTLSPKLQEKFKGTFVVENKAGAGGTIGATAAKRAAPDGYTIFVSSLGPFVIGPHLIKNPGYDPLITGSVSKKQKVLIRVINLGFETQPMHMHGFHGKILGSDQRVWLWANPPLTPWGLGMEKNTLTIGSGETYEWLVNFGQQAVTSTYPAGAVRALGFADVPLLGAQEATVEGGLPRCVRVLIHCYSPRRRAEVQHVYLEEARTLRADLPE